MLRADRRADWTDDGEEAGSKVPPPPEGEPAGIKRPPPPPAEIYEVEDMDGDTDAEYTPLATGAASITAAGLRAPSPPLASGASGAAAATGQQDMNFLIEEID